MPKRGPTRAVTILTVSFNSEAHIRKNVDLTERLNRSSKTQINWLVIENSPKPNGKKWPTHVKVELGPKPPDYAAQYIGSYHHALALNLGLKRAKTRYLIVIDPDFFVTSVGWVDRIIDHMTENDLATIGVAWHPRHVIKIRYAVAPHLAIFDTAKLSLSELDFLPAFSQPAPAPKLGVKKAANVSRLRSGVRWLLDHSGTLLFAAEDLNRRRQIGSSRDTGYRISRLLIDQNIPYEIIPAVFKRPEENFPRYYAGHRLQTAYCRVLEALLPDRYSFIPKKPGYFTNSGFAEDGCPDFDQLGYEEFSFDGLPFAVHLRTFFNETVGGKKIDTAEFYRWLDRAAKISEDRPHVTN